MFVLNIPNKIYNTVMVRIINFFSFKGKQMQLPVEFNKNKNQLKLPILKNTIGSIKNKEVSAQNIFNENGKTVGSGHGKKCSIAAFLTGS